MAKRDIITEISSPSGLWAAIVTGILVGVAAVILIVVFVGA